MKRCAFTLVELLAATALSAMLMTVGFGVLRSIGRPTAATHLLPWTLPLASLLRADMAHSLAVRVDEDGVTLAGLGGLDPSTGQPLHRPALVTYRVAAIGGIRWLIRQQSSLDRSSPPSVELVCANVREVRAVFPAVLRAKSSVPGEPTTLAGDESLPQTFRGLVGFRRAPDRWQLLIDFDGAPTLSIAEAS